MTQAKQARHPRDPGPLWDADERAAWALPPVIRSSAWAEQHRRIWRGRRKGPWRNANAPYLRGLMDIITRPGCVQANIRKAGQVGASEAMRTLIAYWAHCEPDPIGLTLPSEKAGRRVIKQDILPLFRRTDVLRSLIGRSEREVLIESITLLNGFQLDLMWSGSATSTAVHAYRRVINDEIDKFQPWRGEETDAIAATEVRLTSYEDQRLQVNISKPTTTAGRIHQLHEASTVKLVFQGRCPHCGRFQAMRWARVRWMDGELAAACLEAARAAMKAGRRSYVGRPAATGGGERTGPVMKFGDRGELREHIRWLEGYLARLQKAEGRRGLAAAITQERERAVWYQCEGCERPIYESGKAAMVREGHWAAAAGWALDEAGRRHANAEEVERWPRESRIALPISGLPCLWIRWARLAAEWVEHHDNPAWLFYFTTERLGEPFEFRRKGLEPTLLAGKCSAERGALPEGIVPAWAWILLATVDTQMDGFYVVVRAWGGGMRSARVWHGKMTTFAELDRLIFTLSWASESKEFPPMMIARALIDSGGTADRLLEASRTQQVYDYAQPRQPIVMAIKGATRPGAGLYWPMKNPLGRSGRADPTDLHPYMLDTDRCNDLLVALVLQGMAVSAGRADGMTKVEWWMLNRRRDEEYEAHMGAMQKTIDPRTKAEVWTVRATGARHDYRDCEVYQVAAAYMANVHLLPAEEEVLGWKRQAQQARSGRETRGRAEGGDRWTPRPL